MENKLPRGLRNHNPLNIRKTATKWQGLATVQNDPAFLTFISNAYGYRAAFKTLFTYQSQRKLYTIRQMIRRWAPENENNTTAYINNVCKNSGISADVNVFYNQKEDFIKIVMAMSQVENGVPAKKEEVVEGYELAFGKY